MHQIHSFMYQLGAMHRTWVQVLYRQYAQRVRTPRKALNKLEHPLAHVLLPSQHAPVHEAPKAFRRHLQQGLLCAELREGRQRDRVRAGVLHPAAVVKAGNAGAFICDELCWCLAAGRAALALLLGLLLCTQLEQCQSNRSTSGIIGCKVLLGLLLCEYADGEVSNRGFINGVRFCGIASGIAAE